MVGEIKSKLANIDFLNQFLFWYDFHSSAIFPLILQPYMQASRHGAGSVGARYKNSKISKMLLNHSFCYFDYCLIHSLLQVYVLHSVLNIKMGKYMRGSSLSQPFLQKSLAGYKGEYLSLQIW